MTNTFPIEKFRNVRTPFYYYDSALLRQTLDEVKKEAAQHPNFVIHYAVKANANPKILKIIAEAGLGADCVSGGEIEAAMKAGFRHDSIVFAGVGKADWEINTALDADIFCFNVESVPELEVINELAREKGKVANVCFRINPEVGAHTHANITTGLAENKFGIAMNDMIPVIERASKLENVRFIGLHFHIGSQILKMDFELGRSIVGQMGSLITKVLYIKQGVNKKFCIVDAGMSDLIRPALYDATHKIENLTSHGAPVVYDIVGPICESSDVFAKDTAIAESRRGDLLAIRSAGAYGEIMASQYNCRPLPQGIVTEDLK